MNVFLVRFVVVASFVRGRVVQVSVVVVVIELQL